MLDGLREFLCRGRIERDSQTRIRGPASRLFRGLQDSLPQISCDFGKGSLNVQSAQIHCSSLPDRQGLPKKSKGTSMARGIPRKPQKKRALLYSTKTSTSDLGENVTLLV